LASEQDDLTTTNDDQEILNLKHDADRIMLDELDKIQTSGVSEWFAKQVAKIAIGAKLKLGIGMQKKVLHRRNSNLRLNCGMQDVKKNEKSLLAKELHRPIKHKFVRRHVVILGLDDTWSADLIIMPVAHNNYKNILVVIDNFSKYGWCIPLKSKKAVELIEAFENIFKSSNRVCKKIWSDHESGLYSEQFKAFCDNHNIKLYSTQSELKACIAERFVQTIKNKMWRKFTELDYHSLDYYGRSRYKQNSLPWVELLQPIVNEYNNTKHSTIKMTPMEASKPENSNLVHEALFKKYNKWNKKPPKYNVNDFVRIYQWKQDVGKKGYTNNYTREVFKIHEVHDTVPWTYSIIDKNNEVIQGKFYTEQLALTKFDFNNNL
jgi:hypothetical protein